MKQDPNEDARAQGGVDLPMVQRYINFWYSSSLDLFGGEISSNAADFFGSGLKGRAFEGKKFEDHVALEGTYEIDVLEDGAVATTRIPMRNAMNEVLRDQYVQDNERGVARWNKAIRERGVDFQLTLPHRRFNRRMGIYRDMCFDPAGRIISREQFDARRDEWLPTAKDREHIRTLMQPVLEPGKMAHWLGAPARGINGQRLDFEYVRRA
jgi:benzoyl-CoA 2,3-dioxygenase component B